MSDGLDRDGGISFGRKKNLDVKEKVEEKVEEPKRLDTEELLRQERLNAQLVKAKTINYSGFALNGGSIVGLLFVIDNFVFSPGTLDMLEMIFNKTLGLDVDFLNIINLLQEYKAQLIGACMSFQTMLLGYKDICQKAKDRDCDSLYQIFNEELEKIGV